MNFTEEEYMISKALEDYFFNNNQQQLLNQNNINDIKINNNSQINNNKLSCAEIIIDKEKEEKNDQEKMKDVDSNINLKNPQNIDKKIVKMDNNNINDNYKDFEIIDNNENLKNQIRNENSNQNKNEKSNQINNLKNNDKDLSDEEILKCKENGFILIGKTGVGKTSLLNVIFGEEKGKVGYTSKSETSSSNYYCSKEKIDSEYIYFCIIDTPGLYDTQGGDIDKIQKQEIMKLISKENIIIKGLLFLSNFQNERFDASEQTSLIEYNAIFPLKEFWERIILIFTHYYGDPDGDSKEEIRDRSTVYLTEICRKIMNKIKDVSNPIDFLHLKRKYINIYSRAKNEKQINNNILIKKEIIQEISKYIKLKPMFSKLQIIHFEKYEIQKNDKYLYDCDFYTYLDSNGKVVHKEFNIKKKYPKTKEFEKNQKVLLNIEDCKLNENGILVKRTTKKEGIEEIFQNYKGQLGGGITILSLIGAICSGIFFLPALPISLLSMAGGTMMWNNDRIEKNKKKKNDEIILKEKIDGLLAKQNKDI